MTEAASRAIVIALFAAWFTTRAYSKPDNSVSVCVFNNNIYCFSIRALFEVLFHELTEGKVFYISQESPSTKLYFS